MATFIMTRIGGAQNAIPGVGDGGSEKAAVTTYDWTAAVPSGSVLQGPIVQMGSVITGIKVISSGLGSATFSVGDAANPARFSTGQTASPSTSPARPFVQLTTGPILITTAAANTSATGYLDVVVYFLPLNA